jgi:hypothetical protein
VGDYDKALSIVDFIIIDHAKVQALNGVVQAFIEVVGQGGELVQILAAMITIRNKSAMGEALAKVSLTLAQMRDEKGIRQVWEVTNTLSDEDAKSIALRSIAHSFHLIGQEDLAQKVLRSAFVEARLGGRSCAFTVLETGTPILAAIDQGQVLWDVYGSIMKEEDWWRE